MIDTAVQLCGRISYNTAAEADEARRSAQASFGTPLRAKRCKKCSSWHLSFASKLDSRETAILRELAFGFRPREICGTLGITHDQYYYTQRELTRKLGAISRTHLIAVAVSLGVINILESESSYATRNAQGRNEPRASRGREQRSDARG